MEQTELRNDNINLLQQRDRFVEVASHEMRTPLTALKAAAQILAVKNPSEAGLITQINKSVQKLSGMVNDMFDTMRLTKEQFSLKHSAFRLDTLLNQIKDYVLLISNKNIVIEGDLTNKISADEEKIERVHINLIQNALKYAPGSTIEVRIEKLPGFIKFAVIDHGPGIPADKLPHIFRRYYRSDPNGIQTGLGLGLYLSAEIVKQHGGEIGVESQSGKGANFWFTIPAGI